ncbi:MAG: type II secretion system F family protein [Actinomycetes bacterium]
MSPIVLIGALALGCSIPLAWWALSGPRSPRAQATSNLRMGAPSTTNLRETRLAESAQDRVLSPMMQGLAGRARSWTPSGLRDSIEQRIQLAGLGDDWTPDRVFATKAVLGLAGAAVTVLLLLGSPSLRTLVIGVAITALLFFLPDVRLQSKGADRQQLIENQLADVLDQVTVCVEAGLSFDNAVLRVARGSGPLPEELGRTLQDVQLGMTRSAALERLLERTDVSDLRSFVHAFNQAEKYGIPIAQILRVQSTEIRTKRRQRAEERALKLPVKLVFPVVLCILPALFVVVAGPAAIRVAESFSAT